MCSLLQYECSSIALILNEFQKFSMSFQLNDSSKYLTRFLQSNSTSVIIIIPLNNSWYIKVVAIIVFIATVIHGV